MTDATLEDEVPAAELLAAIASEVWASLGLDLAAAPLALALHEECVTASGVVAITGTWQGKVGLECAGELPQRLASVMFAADAAGLSPEDVSDAVGELTNILAGNTKSLLPEPSRLSMPVVTLGASVPGSGRDCLLRSVPLSSFGIPMRVTLWSTERS